MAAMIYAQSRSEMQTIISMPLDLEYNATSTGHQVQQSVEEGIHQLLQEGSNGLCHQLDGSVICNQYSEQGGIGGKLYNLQQQQQPSHNGSLLADVAVPNEDLSCVPLSLPDMPTLSNTTNTGYNDSSLLTMGGRPFLEENPEQSIDENTGSLEHQTNTENEAVGFKGLSWQAFMVDSWYKMCDSQLLEISNDEIASGLNVEADKGFNFSPWDESYVCQKKNHFQITVQMKLKRLPKYIKTDQHELQHIHHFGLHLYGVKFEAPGAVIPIEQSKPDRSKFSYEPLILDFPTTTDQVVKATACRLHFSETTANNMRKRGKPNPDQKYFALVVAIHAYTVSSSNYPVVAYVSERIIVRASNPGQFDNEGDSIWVKNCSGDSAHYHGRVGINTETPDEALTVVGNVSVTGSILHPSDKRLKENIRKITTKEMLDNVCKMTLYSYSFKQDAFTSAQSRNNNPTTEKEEVGLIAQEVQMILPDAIHEKDFQGINDVRMINKDRILMELLGAVQELSKEKEANNILSLQQLSTVTVIVLASLMLFILSSLL